MTHAFQPLLLALMLLAPLGLCAEEVAPPVERAKSWVRESHTTADFKQVHLKVLELVARHQSDLVLLVLDIDNTLLAMNQDLGSDQWFDWQATLQKEDPDSPDLVAQDFDGLLEVQGQLFALGRMHPPEPELPRMVQEVQSLGVATVVLTSRGPAFRNAAERELARNGYDFSRTALVIDERRGAFQPFNPNLPDAHGLSESIIGPIESRLGPVTYSGGIYMTAGQHKGYMLRTLLSRAIPDRASPLDSRIFRAVVFVDDHAKHTQRMHEAYEGANLDLVTFRYSREDGNVANFQASSKRREVQAWKKLKRSLDAVLVK